MVVLLEEKLKHGEDVEKLIRRFLRKVKKFKIIEEYKQHCFYEKPSDKRRREKKINTMNCKKKENERKRKLGE